MTQDGSENDPLAVLREVLAAATHDASAAMCRWTGGLITLTLDEVREVSLQEACAGSSLGEELLTMVVLELPGTLGGVLLLAFDEENGRQLAAALLRSPPPPQAPWSELEKSALTETGNILGCAYLGALARLLDCELLPSAPYFLQDYGQSVLQQALVAQATAGDEVLICRTVFHRQQTQLNWHVLFIPAAALRTAMEKAINGPMAATAMEKASAASSADALATPGRGNGG
jgi:chemotaxis protein CheC